MNIIAIWFWLFTNFQCLLPIFQESLATFLPTSVWSGVLPLWPTPWWLNGTAGTWTAYPTPGRWQRSTTGCETQTIPSKSWGTIHYTTQKFSAEHLGWEYQVAIIRTIDNKLIEKTRLIQYYFNLTWIKTEYFLYRHGKAKSIWGHVQADAEWIPLVQ